MDGTYDAIVLGTGLKECILSGLLSVHGMKVLHLDRNDYYGGASASLNLTQLFQQFKAGAAPPAALGSARDYNIDIIPKFIMANGMLLVLLLSVVVVVVALVVIVIVVIVAVACLYRTIRIQSMNGAILPPPPIHLLLRVSECRSRWGWYLCVFVIRFTNTFNNRTNHQHDSHLILLSQPRLLIMRW
jgi:hypothetical protein